MPKERSVIKLLLAFLTILFFFKTNQIFAQSWLEGNYEVPGNYIGENYTYYTFDKNGTFEFHSGGDLGDYIYATGIYEVDDARVLMNYTTEPILVSNVERREWVEQSDSITIRIRAVNIDEECSGPCVFFYHNGKRHDQNRKYGIELRFKKQEELLVFSMTFISLHPVYLVVSGQRSTEVSFNLQSNERGHPLSGFTEKARVIGSRDGLVTAIMFENGTKIFLQE